MHAPRTEVHNRHDVVTDAQRAVGFDLPQRGDISKRAAHCLDAVCVPERALRATVRTVGDSKQVCTTRLDPLLIKHVALTGLDNHDDNTIGARNLVASSVTGS